MLMKKQLLLFSATCLAMVASCTDDTETVAPSGTAVSDVKMSDKLTRGVNVFISDNIGCDTIYLDTKQDVTLSYNEESGIVFQQVRDEQGYTCLIPDVREANKSAVDEVLITTPDNRSKSVTVILRHNNASSTRATALENRGIDALSRGIPTYSKDGVSNLYIFNKDLIAADKLVIPNTYDAQTDIKEYHETSEERLVSSFSWDFGIGGSVPLDAVIVGIDVNVGRDATDKSEIEREYYMKVKRAMMADYKLDIGRAVNLHEDLGMIYYMNNVLNDMLNNNKDNAAYPRDKKGIYSLLNDYGAYYADFVVLGGSAQMLFSREQNMYQSNVKWDVNVAAKCEEFMTYQKQDGMTGQDFKAYVEAMLMLEKEGKSKWSAQGHLNLGWSSEDYTRVSKANLKVTLKGGNLGSSTNYEGWIPSADPDKWVVVARDESGQTKTTQFIKILNLVKKGIPVDVDDNVPDSECSYAQLINRYFDQYFIDNNPKDVKSTPFVIADFLMISAGHANQEFRKKYIAADDKLDVHEGDYPKPFIMTSPDGVERIYYPMMMNNQDTDICNANSYPGYALETARDSYLCKTHNRNHYWYYAIDHAGRCKGIEDIKIAKDAPGPEYVRRGDISDDGITGCYNHNYVWVKFGSDTNYTVKKGKSSKKYNGSEREGEYMNKITGVALRCGKHNKILGATAGSDSPFPFTPVGNKRLDMLWNYPLQNAWKQTYEEFYYSIMTVCNHPLYIEQTKEVLDDEYFLGIDIDPNNVSSGLDVNKRHGSIPKTWGEQL